MTGVLTKRGNKKGKFGHTDRQAQRKEVKTQGECQLYVSSA